jgi:hypothetical protein
LQPFQDDRGVEPARVREHNFFHRLTLVVHNLNPTGK